MRRVKPAETLVERVRETDWLQFEAMQPFLRESYIAAELIASGATAISYASPSRQARYGQAFFALGAGLERSSKLALVVGRKLAGQPRVTNQELRTWGHNVQVLFKEVEELLGDLPDLDGHRWLARPNSGIDRAIMENLTSFSNNVTRYYNIEAAAGSHAWNPAVDPIARWHTDVVEPIITQYNVAFNMRHRLEQSRRIASAVERMSLARSIAQDGRRLSEVYSHMENEVLCKGASKFARLHVLRLARFLATALSEMGDLAFNQGRPEVPHFREIFGIFCNSDDVFKRRKTWSIYHS